MSAVCYLGREKPTSINHDHSALRYSMYLFASDHGLYIFSHERVSSHFDTLFLSLPEAVFCIFLSFKNLIFFLKKRLDIFFHSCPAIYPTCCQAWIALWREWTACWPKPTNMGSTITLQSSNFSTELLETATCPNIPKGFTMACIVTFRYSKSLQLIVVENWTSLKIEPSLHCRR